MISLWQTSSNINFKFTTQTQCRPTNIQIYGHVHATHSDYTVFFSYMPFLVHSKTKHSTFFCLCNFVLLFLPQSSYFSISVIRSCSVRITTCRFARTHKQTNTNINSIEKLQKGVGIHVVEMLSKTVIYYFLRCELVFIICSR